MTIDKNPSNLDSEEVFELSISNEVSDFYEFAKKYLGNLPHDIRSAIDQITSQMYIDIHEGSIKLGNAVIDIPKDFNTLSHTIELLIRRSKFGDRLKDKIPYVVLVLTPITREYIESKVKKPLQISVEVKHVTEREEIAYQVAKQILNEYIIRTFYITSATKQVELGIYCYDGLIYRPCDKVIESRIMELVSLNEGLAKKTTRWVMNEALYKVRVKTLTPLHYEPMMIAFRNVLFDWEIFTQTLSLRKSIVLPNPDRIAFIKIPHELPVEALNKLEGLLKFDESLAIDIEEIAKKFCPRTLEAFKEWVGDKWLLLFEIEGAILIPKSIKKAFLLVDTPDKVGDTGKSTYIRYLQKLIGRENYTSISLQELTNPEYRFRASTIYRKLANFYPDLPNNAIRIVGTFKVITGQDVILIEEKRKHPFPWLPYTKHVFSANEPPPVFNADRAFWNRWLVIEFLGNFKERIENFENTLLNEAPYSLLVSIIAFGKVISRGWRFSYEDTPEDAKRKWMMRSDSVYAFFISMIEDGVLVEDPNSSIRTAELYDMYTKWCRENGVTPVDHRVFPNRIRKVLGYQIKRLKDGTHVIGLRKPQQKKLM